MGLAQTFVTNAKNKFESFTFPVTLVTNSTVASIKMYAPNTSAGIYLFSKTDGQTITTYAASPGFTTADLTDTSAPGIFGAIVQVKDAATTQVGGVGVEIIPSSIAAGSTGLTALGTVTLKGASSSGVTSEGYLSFIFGLTGVDPDASSSTATFLMRVTYQKA